MSEHFRDLSMYGITSKDQQEWNEVKHGYQELPPFPEVLRDTTKPVFVLNMAEEYVQDYDKRVLRTLIGKIDVIFKSGLITEEAMEARKKFDDSFRQEAVFDNRTFAFERTKIFHLPEDQYELIVQPTEWTWGKMKVQDTPPREAVELFGINSIDNDTEIIVIPPCQSDIGLYAKAVEEIYGRTPHIAFWTVTRFANNVGWSVTEYREGMPNLMGMEDGAL